ncbi:MAG: hypothetical protein ABI662_09285, partial [Dermatophilaceae bacterium]
MTCPGTGGQAGDQHSVLLIGLVRGQVFRAPRPRRHERLHAHERQAPLRGQLTQHPPPVPGRLTRHRRPGEPGPRRTLGGPVQRDTHIPGPAAERPPRQHLRVVIGDHDHLLL